MSAKRGFGDRFGAWWGRNGLWWWLSWAVAELVFVAFGAGIFGALWAAVFAFWAGWHWREHVAIRRLERLDGQTGRDLIIATAQRYNRYGFAIEYVPMSDLLRKRGDGQ